jgi:phospholipid-transporting ATPase
LDIHQLTKYDTIIPLTVIILITVVKNFYADYKRRKADHCINSRKFEVWDKDKFEEIRSSELKVG